MKAALLLIAEKVAWTFAQQFVVVLLAVGTTNLYHAQAWSAAADTAGFAALVCLATSLVVELTSLRDRLTGTLEVAVRVVLTFVQSVAGSLLAAGITPSVVHFPWRGAVAVAIPVTLVALLKLIAAHADDALVGASTVPRRALAKG